MKNCPQTEGQSVLQHGFSVKNYLFDLINHLKTGSNLKYNWVLPDWVYENKELILQSLPDEQTLKLYTIFHDCGKPFCLQIDENGKRHFPDHANVSYQIFKQIFNNDVAADLIKHDMLIHITKSENTIEFCKTPYFLTLLVTGLAEIHSNSNMFGGLKSQSFRIKHKSITQRGKQIFKIISENIHIV